MTESDHNTETSSGTRWQLLLRFIVILGIIVLLFFISVGIVRFVPKLFGGASTYLSSLFGSNPLETFVDKKEVRSGDGFYITWKNNTKDTEGQYAFSFKCTDGVRIEYQSVSGLKPVICGTLFPLPHDTASYPFVASSTTNKGNVSVPYSVNLWDKTTNKSKLSATSNIVIIPKDAPYSDAVSNSAAVSLYQSGSTSSNPYDDATTTPTTTLGGFGNGNTGTATSSSSSTGNTGGTKTSNTSSSGSSNQSTTYAKTYGSSPNLGISFVKVGYVDNNANYYNTSSIPENARVLVSFNVANTGDAPTGTWTLTANLPTKISYERVFTSGSQPSILPGNSFEMTMAFDSFDPSISAITLSVSSNSDVSSGNNYLSIPLTNGGYNGGNGGGGYNSGAADLVVRIIDVGVTNNNNSFYYSNSLSTSDKVAVKFEIENRGGTATGQWYFKANLPTNTNNIYTSGAQNSLAPGQKTQFTLGFDNPTSGSGYIQITADSSNNVSEQNENNNTDSRNIYVNGNNNNNYNNNYGTLSGDCYASPSNPNKNQSVSWIANASGGNGNYSYSWSGDAYGNGNYVSNSYSSGGNKYATVTIYSNGESIQRSCNVYVNY